MKLSNLAEVYHAVSTHPVLSKEIDTQPMDDRLLQILGNQGDGMKSKDIFNILAVTTRKELIDQAIAQAPIESMIPEEIVIMN